jgi:hypothetical protein
MKAERRGVENVALPQEHSFNFHYQLTLIHD